MPTRTRRLFAGQAIWYFLRQDYSQKELIIVDDGKGAIADLVPQDERIRYVRLAKQHSLGEKRNIACQLSRGKWIAHWDDDDWFGPQRLSSLVARTEEANVLLSGARQALHYRLEQGEAWSGSFPAARQAKLFNSTLFYRREAWEAHPFTTARSDECRLFIQLFPSEAVLSLPEAEEYIGLIHRGSTSPPNLSDPAWKRRPIEEVSRRMGVDRYFYVRLRNQPAVKNRLGPLHPVSVSPEPVNFASTFIVYDGYGSVAEFIALGMARSGANVHVIPLRIDYNGISSDLRQLLAQSRPDPRAPTICFSWPRENFSQFRQASDLFISTMWETNQLPNGWSKILNQARAVIVPSKFNARIFRESGVKVPIEVVSLGFDPAIYRFEPRSERAGLTTLMVGLLAARKNIFEGVAAWKKAFAGDLEARLVIKARFQVMKWVPDDPRITLIDTTEASRGIAHYYREADILMALGNEGFGLPLVEGMASGLPVIALNSEGQADVCEAAEGLVLSVKPARWVPFDEKMFGPSGVRAIPDIDEIARWLRWVDEHREEARAMGKAAADWALRHRNVWDTGPALLDVVEKYRGGRGLLRRKVTLWAPANTRTGEYARRLAQASRLIQVVHQRPDLRSTRTLHIFHEEGQFDEVELTRTVQQAAYSGVPVLVTEQKVGNEARAWERDASLLVVPSEPEAEKLRLRWPGKQVECLPFAHHSEGNLKNESETNIAKQYRKLWTRLS